MKNCLVLALASSPALALAQVTLDLHVLSSGGSVSGGDVLVLGQPFVGASAGSFVADFGFVPAAFGACPADFNGDSAADFFDYLDFVAAFDAELPGADFNRDGAIDFFDYLDFVSTFDVGC